MGDRVVSRAYRWKVVKDPDGVFRGNLFRMDDIEESAKDPDGWPDGITFEHIYSRAQIVFKNGRLIWSQA